MFSGKVRNVGNLITASLRFSSMKRFIDNEANAFSCEKRLYAHGDEIYSRDPQIHMHSPCGRMICRSLWQRRTSGKMELAGMLIWGCFGMRSEYGKLIIGDNCIDIFRNGSVSQWKVGQKIIGQVHYPPFFGVFKFSRHIQFSLGEQSVTLSKISIPLLFSTESRVMGSFEMASKIEIPFKIRTLEDECLPAEVICHNKRTGMEPSVSSIPVIMAKDVRFFEPFEIIFLTGIALLVRVFYAPFGGHSERHRDKR